MGLKLDFPDRTKSNNLTENCYIKAEKNLNGNNKRGSLELQIWASKEDRDSNSKKLNQVSIEVSKSDELKDSDDCITNINYYDIEFKTGADFYNYIKSLKVKVLGTIINISTATDWV